MAMLVYRRVIVSVMKSYVCVCVSELQFYIFKRIWVYSLVVHRIGFFEFCDLNESGIQVNMTVTSNRLLLRRLPQSVLPVYHLMLV